MHFLLKVILFHENVTDVIWELFSKLNVIAFTNSKNSTYNLRLFEVKELKGIISKLI